MHGQTPGHHGLQRRVPLQPVEHIDHQISLGIVVGQALMAAHGMRLGREHTTLGGHDDVILTTLQTKVLLLQKETKQEGFHKIQDRKREEPLQELAWFYPYSPEKDEA